jgi:hypothetical protein
MSTTQALGEQAKVELKVFIGTLMRNVGERRKQSAEENTL